MSWIITPRIKSVDGVGIGLAYGGGYIAGFISNTADSNPTHALIVAPAATGATGTGYTLIANLQWKNANTITPGTTNAFDGSVNTAAMIIAGIANHPAAQFCVNLSIGGYTDWYLPSWAELDIAYKNLKPTTTANLTTSGINPYSVPASVTNNSSGSPAQTSNIQFRAGGSEAFSASVHYSSSEVSAVRAMWINYNTGEVASYPDNSKTNSRPVRAFRRIAL